MLLIDMQRQSIATVSKTTLNYITEIYASYSNARNNWYLKE